MRMNSRDFVGHPGDCARYPGGCTVPVGYPPDRAVWPFVQGGLALDGPVASPGKRAFLATLGSRVIYYIDLQHTFDPHNPQLRRKQVTSLARRWFLGIACIHIFSSTALLLRLVTPFYF